MALFSSLDDLQAEPDLPGVSLSFDVSAQMQREALDERIKDRRWREAMVVETSREGRGSFALQCWKLREVW